MAMKSSEYWKKREAENAMKNQISEVQYKKDIEEIYANMMDEINKEINGFYTKYAAKEGITMAEAKKRVSKLDIAAYERKAKKYVETKDLSDQANEEMRIYNLTMKVNRLELLKANIGLEMVSGFDEMQKYFDKKLTDRTLKEFQRQAGILGKSVLKNEKYAHAIVNASFKNATYSDRIWMYQGMLKAELEGLLASGLIRGQNPKKLAKHLEKRFGVSAYNAQRLMTAELARVQTEAQKQSFVRNGFDEYEYIACGNNDVCSVCKALDGKPFKVDDMMPGENAPPMHPNCHCSTVAYMDNEAYEEWINSYQEHGLNFEDWQSSMESEKLVDKLSKYEKDFEKLTEGYSYDEFVNDFGSVEEGFDGSDANEIKKAKEIAEKIEKIRKKLNDKEKKNYKSNAKEDPIAKFESCGIKFRNNSSTELPEEIINKYADFVSDFEAKHASYFNKNKLQLNSISVVDDLKENGKTAAGAYYSKSRSIKLMKKSIESKPTSKLITYSKSDDYKIHFFAHEYGHYIADSLNKNFSVEDYDIVQSSLLRYFDGDIFKAKTSNLVDVLGSYGSKDARETFAEAFAEAYTCKNPRKFAKIFKEELEKTLKRSSSTGRYQSSIAKGKGNDIINSGAVKGALTDKNDPLYVKRDAHAIKYYESVRRSKKNNMVKTIANNTGISEKSINKVYDHVFIKEHELYGGKRRFDPDYDMAESFRRLREGKNIQEHDLIMLKHERLEYELMNKKHMSYQEAHRLAEKKYNYQKALKEFKNKNNL
jgi:SPP1 gp7 family putative phage head morphogenesis protein